MLKPAPCVSLPLVPLQMGLGKTAQAISVLAFQKQFGGCRGPFLGES
jgi:SNF2 family DNA or RNA helicase